jgi:hypothetical protein
MRSKLAISALVVMRPECSPSPIPSAHFQQVVASPAEHGDDDDNIADNEVNGG